MIRLKLITLSGVKADKDIFELMVPTTAGTIAINEGHAPLVGAVAPGVLYVREQRNTADSSREQFGVYDGTVEVLNNEITVLVDEADAPEDISQSEAESAFNRARELKKKAGDSVALADAQAIMDRQAVRLKLAGVRKNSSKRRS